MIKYFFKDMTDALCYLPYGLVVGVIVFLLLTAINKGRLKRHRKGIHVTEYTCFITYLFIMLSITLLFREGGSSSKLDLDIFSTWGINSRNNAYVLENIFLFIPYGFLCAWVIKSVKNLFNCTMLGLITSMVIEFVQLLTGRGYFQIDDILTNTLGAVVGYIFFRCIRRKKK